MPNRPEIAPPGQVERGAEGGARPLTPGAGMSTKGPEPAGPKAPAFGVTTAPETGAAPPSPPRRS